MSKFSLKMLPWIVVLNLAVGFAIASLLKQAQASSPTPVASGAIASPVAPLTSEQIQSSTGLWAVEVWIVLEDGSHAPASGFVVSKDGLIVTCFHVAAQQQSMEIKFTQSKLFPEGKTYTATTVKSDRAFDLALLQIQGLDTELQSAPLAKDSSHLSVGDPIYAIGSPEGTHWKFSTGKVVGMNSSVGLREIKGVRSNKGFIAPGNSGGAMLDSKGEVVCCQSSASRVNRRGCERTD